MQGAQVLSQDWGQLGCQLGKHEQGALHQSRIPALSTMKQERKQLWPPGGLKDGHGKLCHCVADLQGPGHGSGNPANLHEATANPR